MSITELRDALNRATNEGNLSPNATVLVEAEPGVFNGIADAFIDGEDLVISTDG